jgi:O-antigen biosynthesis protein
MVTYNRIEFTRKAIDALIRHTHHPYVLTIVDNASRDGTQAYLRELQRKGVVKNLLLLPENIGVARASNLAWSQESAAAHYLKLDNDIVIQKPGWLGMMVEVIDKLPELGAVGYNFESSSFPVQDVRGCQIRLKTGNLGGACYLVPKRVHERLGFWCEDYGLYGEEDADYSARLELAGLKNAYMEDENIGIHLPGGKAGRIDPLSYAADDPEELHSHPEYRLWKDRMRRALQSSGALGRNQMAYRQGTRSLYVTTGKFLGKLGHDLQVFKRHDGFAFLPMRGELQPEHRQQIAAWVGDRFRAGFEEELLVENGRALSTVTCAMA